MSRAVIRRRKRPLTEWEQRSPEERAAIVKAPFGMTRRVPGKTWAGTIVVDETDDPVLRHYKSLARQESSSVSVTSGTADNVFRSMEG